MAATVGAAAARRSAEPEFIVGATGAPPKRARRKADDDDADLGLLPAQRRVYTSFAIDETHHQKLEEIAWARKQRKVTNKFDMSTPLRDLLDFFMSHEREVNAWIAKRRNSSQGNR